MAEELGENSTQKTILVGLERNFGLTNSIEIFSSSSVLNYCVAVW